MEHSYFKNFLPKLIEMQADYNLHYEVKSNLTREQIKTLSQAGIRRMQPGIESLSSHILQLMRKGVTAIQNVNTLRWALYYDIRVAWNLLWGFPGETAADYDQQARLFPHLVHLQPPGHWGPIWMERFSPIFKDRQHFPAHYIRPELSYKYVYPGHVDLDEVAYFFDYEFENTLPESAYTECKQRGREWAEKWDGEIRPTLNYWLSPDLLQIEDRRNPEGIGTYNFHPPLSSIYVACSDRPRTVEALIDLLQLTVPRDEVEEALHGFCARGLMMQDGRQFLSLALPISPGR
jgi:ribosomal peptide maturation radical SAM protein 1